jgi:hypothetical protein
MSRLMTREELEALWGALKREYEAAAAALARRWGGVGAGADYERELAELEGLHMKRLARLMTDFILAEYPDEGAVGRVH